MEQQAQFAAQTDYMKQGSGWRPTFSSGIKAMSVLETDTCQLANAS